MTDEPNFWHEKLHVYQQSLLFVSSTESLIAEITDPAAVLDHLERASESVAENIVNGNSQWSRDAKCRYFGIARGSALECAACMDVCCLKGLVSAARRDEAKEELQQIVRMLVGLIRSQGLELREETDQYKTVADKQQDAVYFEHERLEVYRLGLSFVGWAHAGIQEHEAGVRRRRKLDGLGTSIVLNIAEGNGRVAPADHRNFIDIAHRAAIKAALQLDLVRAKGITVSVDLETGKQMLGSIVRMLLGMHGYFDRADE